MPNDQVLGALIGLANTHADHQDAWTNDMSLLMHRALMADALTEAAANDLVIRIREAKFTLSPGCRTCTHPCGKNSDHDMALLALESPSSRQIKLAMLDRLRQLAHLTPSRQLDALMLPALRAVSEYHREENLQKCLDTLTQALLHTR